MRRMVKTYAHLELRRAIVLSTVVIAGPIPRDVQPGSGHTAVVRSLAFSHTLMLQTKSLEKCKQVWGPHMEDVIGVRYAFPSVFYGGSILRSGYIRDHDRT
jgi:hypothetical protein